MFFLLWALMCPTKMCRLFPCIPIFRWGGGRLLKSVKKIVCVVVLKITLLLVKSVFIKMGMGIRKLGCWIAAKHTTEFFRSNVHYAHKIWSLTVTNSQ